jgi:hypothetical protein
MPDSQNNTPVQINGGDCSSDPFHVLAKFDNFSDFGKGSRTPAIRFHGNAELRDGRITYSEFCFAVTLDELIEKFTKLGFDISLPGRPEKSQVESADTRLAGEEEYATAVETATSNVVMADDDWADPLDEDVPVGQPAVGETINDPDPAQMPDPPSQPDAPSPTPDAPSYSDSSSGGDSSGGYGGE